MARILPEEPTVSGRGARGEGIFGPTRPHRCGPRGGPVRFASFYTCSSLPAPCSLRPSSGPRSGAGPSGPDHTASVRRAARARRRSRSLTRDAGTISAGARLRAVLSKPVAKDHGDVGPRSGASFRVAAAGHPGRAPTPPSRALPQSAQAFQEPLPVRMTLVQPMRQQPPAHVGQAPQTAAIFKTRHVIVGHIRSPDGGFSGDSGRVTHDSGYQE